MNIKNILVSYAWFILIPLVSYGAVTIDEYQYFKNPSPDVEIYQDQKGEYYEYYWKSNKTNNFQSKFDSKPQAGRVYYSDIKLIQQVSIIALGIAFFGILLSIFCPRDVNKLFRNPFTNKFIYVVAVVLYGFLATSALWIIGISFFFLAVVGCGTIFLAYNILFAKEDEYDTLPGKDIQLSDHHSLSSFLTGIYEKYKLELPETVFLTQTPEIEISSSKLMLSLSLMNIMDANEFEVLLHSKVSYFSKYKEDIDLCSVKEDAYKIDKDILSEFPVETFSSALLKAKLFAFIWKRKVYPWLVMGISGGNHKENASDIFLEECKKADQEDLLISLNRNGDFILDRLLALGLPELEGSPKLLIPNKPISALFENKVDLDKELSELTNEWMISTGQAGA